MDKNARNLVIVESPNKTQTLTKIFKDAGYKDTFVVASYGHIAEILTGTGYKQTGIEPDDDFKAKYAIMLDKKQKVEEIKLQVEKADHVYICSDPDREGEAIAWELKKFLKIPEKKYTRVTFHEITPSAVLKAIDNPRKIDDDLVKAAQSRAKLDKIFGFGGSAVSRKKVGARSVGRCQSAGLKLAVIRELEIQNFVAETFWELYLNFIKGGETFKAKYVGTDKEEIKKFTAVEDANKVYAECKAPYVVVDAVSKDKLNYPKAPFITSTFQQEVSSKLGISVKVAMSYAQRLFEGINIGGEHIALITYIRTDSEELAPEFLPELEKHIKDNYGKEYYAGVRKAKNNELAQDGHEAIRPVDMSMTPTKLAQYINDKDLIKVYELIYKRTEACGMKPSITAETTYKIESGNHIFNLISRELKFDGYKKAYSYKDDDAEEDTAKVTFQVGEEITDDNHPALELTKKSTKPPVRYKEATLIKDLESKGIGRPSTYQKIIETLEKEDRGYCKVQDGYLVPTELGINLIKFLDQAFPDICNLTYTAEMEKDLDLISKNKLDDIKFLTDFFNKLKIDIQNSYKTESNKPKAELTDRICPDCGAPLVIRTSSKGTRFFGCSKYPKCKYVEWMNN